MEKIMKIWAKISSVIIVGLAIYGIYSIATVFFIPILQAFFIISIIVGVGLIYIPLIYFAWVKNPKRKGIKTWAKVITIMIGFYLFSHLFDFSKFEDFNYLISFFFTIIAAVPIYYYAWKNKKS